MIRFGRTMHQLFPSNVIQIPSLAGYNILATSLKCLASRAIAAGGQHFYLSEWEEFSPDHLNYLQEIGIGPKNIHVLKGHNLDAVANDIELRMKIARFLNERGYLWLFHPDPQSPGSDVKVLKKLQEEMMIPWDRLNLHVIANPFQNAYLCDKIKMRQKLGKASEYLFTPYEIVDLSKSDGLNSLKFAAYSIRNRSGCKHVLVRMPNGASSEGMINTGENSYAEIHRSFVCGNIKQVLVEPYYPDHLSLSFVDVIPWDLSDDIQLRGMLTQQMNVKGLRDFWAGNVLLYGNEAIPGFSPGVAEQIYDKTKVAIKELYKIGVRGPISVDFIIVDGKAYACEVNLRTTNGCYAYQTLYQIHQQGMTPYPYVGFVILKPKEPDHSELMKRFASWREKLGFHFYTKGGYGVIPVVLSDDGQVVVAVVQDSYESFQHCVNQLWEIANAKGDSPFADCKREFSRV